jgi:ribonucleoside-diphosphate reductase alpha subunit
MLYVTKRDGRKENVHFDKITERITKLINPMELKGLELPWLNIEKEVDQLDPNLVAMKVVGSMYPGITTEELDIESAEICVNLSTTHPSYGYLGGRILVSNLHKKTVNSFSEKTAVLKSLLNKEYYDWIMENKEELDSMVNYNLDYLYDYFGFKTLEKSYLMKLNGMIIERPQDMLLRVAISLQLGNIDKIRSTYNMMAYGYYTHASPTLFNSGTNHMQLSSCFLLGTNDDLQSITETWNSCAMISKWAGGIGLHVSNIRGKDSLIKGTSGRSNGLVPFLKVFNDIARWIDQGGRRPGSIAIYLEPHHPDIMEFLELRKNFGSETERARDLFLSLWISDLFMKQVESDGDWYLLSADECAGLTDAYGDAYDTLYWKYVNEGKYRSKIPARKVWTAIMESQIETGMPYIAYKDSINTKSNQMNIGTVRSSNLCVEIVQYSDHKEYAVCNLASIALKPFIIPFQFSGEWTIYSKPNCMYCEFAKNYLKNHNIIYTEIPFSQTNLSTLKQLLPEDLKQSITFPQIFHNNKHIGGWHELYHYTAGTFNWDKLYDVAYMATFNLNQVIDINYYPVPQTKFSNMRHRPIGLGIQGLADALVMMRIPFDSDEAVRFNEKMMETIYLASATASNDMAKERYEGMVLLIQSGEEFPEYYDKNIKLDNILYHKLKPNKWELSRDIQLSTLGSYSSFDGSPMSQGKFQFDMWKDVTLNYPEKWEELRKDIIKYGTRNSMLTALMPTASTSQILGNNECFEFFTNNIYSRKTQAGNFVLVNKYLVNDMISVGIWSKDMKDHIIAMNGSIQMFDNIPPEFKSIYKTIWEIKQIWVLKGAKARGPFVDQTQSMNIFMAEPDYQRLSSSHFWGWKNGLKTGMYYLRSKPASDAIKFTIDPKLLKSMTSAKKGDEDDGDGGCTNCSA